MASHMNVLSPPEVGHVLLGLLDIGEILQETASCPLEVSVGLVPVQVAIALSLELEHLVPESSALAAVTSGDYLQCGTSSERLS